MSSQTEFERGFLAGVNAMKIAATNSVLNTEVQTLKEEKEKS